MVKFTPGPWCVSTDEYGDVLIDRVGDEDRICTVGRSAIASFGHFDTPEVRADANLIAAAPELYDALHICLAMAGRALKSSMNLNGDSPYDIGIAALRKARGELA